MKLRTLFSILLCITLVCSCSSKKKKIDDNGLLTKEELVSVLIDIHMFDATISTIETKEHNNPHPRLQQKMYDSLLLTKHECNDSIFRASIEYYTLNGNIKDIYTQVVDSLNTLKVITEQEEKKNSNLTEMK